MPAPLVIDTHVHLYRSRADAQSAKGEYDIWEYGRGASVHFSELAGDAEDGRTALEAAGASWVAVANLISRPKAEETFDEDLRDYNSWLCDLANEDSRILPIIGIDPIRLGVSRTLEQMDEFLGERGARGMKIHPPLQSLDVRDDSWWQVLQRAEALRTVVLSHSGPDRQGSGRGEPQSFAALLAAFPNLRLILAHLGGAAWRQVPELAQAFPQVLFDLSEIISWVGAERAPSATELVALIRDVGPSRVLLGSDFPWYDISDVVAAVQALPGLSEGETAAILGENAASLFGLDV
ncbi:MAG TPA: amidohydrolase family protein [Candidatus Limnocylindrales bacterium]|nr:amidohydrolase family protein [Candidatus Limnocylindrales bacterium]